VTARNGSPPEDHLVPDSACAWTLPPGAGWTASDALLDALEHCGVTHLYVNLGSDHPELIESLAKRAASGHHPFRVVTCPHENVALTAAQAHAMVSGQPQAVFVHVDVGTQTLGGALHNAFRARVPVFIFAGETPFTLNGELLGSRNRPAQILQDVPDQHSVVRAYVKWSMSVRTGRNIRDLVYRGMQLARSEPCGVVYLSGAREVMSEALDGPATDQVSCWPALTPSALPPVMAREIAEAVSQARKPVLITSYFGRRPERVAALVRMAERVGIMVVEESPVYLNFPRSHPLHAGYLAAEVVSDADLILVVDCDVPWINATIRLSEGVRIYQIDTDPLKESIPLWHVPARAFSQADSALALEQIEGVLDRLPNDDARVVERTRVAAMRHAEIETRAKARLQRSVATLNPDSVAACLAGLLDDDAIVIDETVTSSMMVLESLPRDKPGTYLASGGSSLGFGGGGSIGARLAAPERTVVCLTGDGSYLFGVPSAVHIVAARYRAPFLTVIMNNGGWNATKQNLLRLRPDGYAQRDDRFWVGFGQEADLAGIAAAAGRALALTVREPDQLEPLLRQALEAVRGGQCAVVDVRLPPITLQDP